MGSAKCVHSALRNDEMDGGTAAVRPAGGKGGIGFPKSGGSSPESSENVTDFIT